MVVVNFKLVIMRGVKLGVMLLVVVFSEDNDSIIELVDLFVGVKLGERFFFEGWEVCILDFVLKLKEKIWEIL